MVVQQVFKYLVAILLQVSCLPDDKKLQTKIFEINNKSIKVRVSLEKKRKTQVLRQP